MDSEKLEKHIKGIALALAQEQDPARRDELAFLVEAYARLHDRLRGQRSNRLLASDDRRRASTSAMGLRTELTGCRWVTVSISQLFRMSDLIIDPSGVRGELSGTIGATARLRRTLNERRAIHFEGLGDLRPVAAANDRFNRFWVSMIPNLKNAPTTDPPLPLVPFEISPLPRLEGMRVDANSWLREIVLDTVEPTRSGARVADVRGSFRLYTTGVGVIRLAIELDFPYALDVELVATVAKRVESLLFVDAEGGEKPFERFFGDIVNAVASYIFVDPGESERRWRPPETIFRFHQGDFDPEVHTGELAYLMSLSPGNRASIADLRRRLIHKLRSPHWIGSGVLAVASNRVTLLLKRGGGNDQEKKFRRRVLGDLLETHELVNVGLHTRRLFAEDFSEIRELGGPDSEWLPGSDNFSRLQTLSVVTLRALRAVGTIRRHIERTGEGIIMRFAREVWAMDRNGHSGLHGELAHVAKWIAGTGYGTEENLARLARTLQGIAAIPEPFNAVFVPAVAMEIEEQELLENEILDGLEGIDAMLDRDDASFEDLDRGIMTVELARRRLHGKEN